MRVETERMGGGITVEYKNGFVTVEENQYIIMERIIMQNDRRKKI